MSESSWDVEAIVRGSLRLLGAMLPVSSDWVEGLVAEVTALPTRGDKIRFAFSGALGLIVIGSERLIATHVDKLPALLFAAVAGLLVGTVDLLSYTRWWLLIVVPAASITIGVMLPAVRRSSAILFAIGLPLQVALTGFAGPYTYDRADVWLPLLPAIALAEIAALVRIRLQSRHDTRADRR